MAKTYEDWFKRGGERPPRDGRLPPPPEETEIPGGDDGNGGRSPVVTCRNCGGDNLADEECCTHCGSALAGDGADGGAEGPKEFEVKLLRTRHVCQTCTVRVLAASVFEACDEAIRAAPKDDASWEDRGDPGFDDLDLECTDVNEV